MRPQKNCLICKNIFVKALNFGKTKWENKKFCSIKCRSVAQIGVTKLIHTADFREAVKIRHTGKINSCTTRRKMAVSKMGENNPNWKGGVTPANLVARNIAEYHEWRKAVLSRDNYTCVFCNIKQGWNKQIKKQIKIHADHIKPFAVFTELRYCLENGRTLCVECHKKTPTYGASKTKLTSKDGTQTNLPNPVY